MAPATRPSANATRARVLRSSASSTCLRSTRPRSGRTSASGLHSPHRNEWAGGASRQCPGQRPLLEAHFMARDHQAHIRQRCLRPSVVDDVPGAPRVEGEVQAPRIKGAVPAPSRLVAWDTRWQGDPAQSPRASMPDHRQRAEERECGPRQLTPPPAHARGHASSRGRVHILVSGMLARCTCSVGLRLTEAMGRE